MSARDAQGGRYVWIFHAEAPMLGDSITTHLSTALRQAASRFYAQIILRVFHGIYFKAKVKMSDDEWKAFFQVCASVLGKGAHQARYSDSWCGWTTFDKLSDCIYYWNSSMPNPEDLQSTNVSDFRSAGGQPFLYQSIAHIVIPKEFGWESQDGGDYVYSIKTQDIDQVSKALFKAGIQHRKTALILEIKLY
ncbi:MAG: hypothetical protein V4805_03945 [Pseudomonadota bacterium]